MDCEKCSKPAVMQLPYGPHAFCKQHFLSFFEKRVRKNINYNKLVESKDRIAIGVSGGKDSLTTAFLLKKIFPNPHAVFFQAVLIDEGIPQYREKALKIARENLKEWEIPFEVFSFKKEFGMAMIEMSKKLKEKKVNGESVEGYCSYCGVLRRKLLNEKALELDCSKLATGHNLDDEVQTFLMNAFENDFARTARLGAKIDFGIKGFASRIKPLYDSLEKDVVKFAELRGIKVYSGECCPFTTSSKRRFFKKVLDNVEEAFPKSKFAMLKFSQKIAENARKKNAKSAGEKSAEKRNAIKESTCIANRKAQSKKSEVSYCKECGDVTSGIECASCKQLKKLKL